MLLMVRQVENMLLEHIELLLSQRYCHHTPNNQTVHQRGPMGPVF